MSDASVNMVLNVKTIRLIRDGEKGGRGYGGGGRGRLYSLATDLHCHHQNDSCIKIGSDESHFNVSVGSDGQSSGFLLLLFFCVWITLIFPSPCTLFVLSSAC